MLRTVIMTTYVVKISVADTYSIGALVFQYHKVHNVHFSGGSKEDRRPIIQPNFPENCMKMKTFDDLSNELDCFNHCWRCL